jgi:hypothetical protein
MESPSVEVHVCCCVWVGIMNFRFSRRGCGVAHSPADGGLVEEAGARRQRKKARRAMVLVVSP